MNRPKYSIIIPTCERANLLEHTMNGCLLQEYSNYEILVSNNSSNDETAFILDNFKSESKIRVVETKTRLAMPNHWEFAISYALGEYIIFLGDDDGISPSLLKVLDDVIELSGSNIIKWQSVLYHHPDWPDVKANTLRISSKCSFDVHDISPDQVIRDYTNCEFKYFPNLLQTCFSHALFNRAKEKAGKVFVGAPDYSCPALLLMDAKAKYVHVDAVLGFGGRSKISNAAYSTSKDKSKAKRHKEFVAEFRNEDPFPYHPLKIWAQDNIVMAPFNYALHFYPEVIPGYSLNMVKLCEGIQNEILQRKGKDSLIDKKQIKQFYDFVETLAKKEKNIIKRMTGYPLFRSRGKMIGKSIRYKGRKAVALIGRAFPEKIRPKIKSIGLKLMNKQLSGAPINPVVYLDVSKYGCFNGRDVMLKLNSLAELIQKDNIGFPYLFKEINDENGDGIRKIGRMETILGDQVDSQPKYILKELSS